VANEVALPWSVAGYSSEKRGFELNGSGFKELYSGSTKDILNLKIIPK
jgi:hypothetical protein